MKLTPVQNKVINCLQRGADIITDSHVKGAWISFPKSVSDMPDFHINNGVFYNLLKKGLIIQSLDIRENFNYKLTELGKSIKTKPLNHDRTE